MGVPFFFFKERFEGVSRQEKTDLLLPFRSQTLVKADRALVPHWRLPLHIDTAEPVRERGNLHHKLSPQPQTASFFSQVEAIHMQKAGSIEGWKTPESPSHIPPGDHAARQPRRTGVDGGQRVLA